MDVDKLNSLTAALEYIEHDLSGEFSQEQCAKAACCSLSGLQKLFRSVFNKSVGDYVTRRRLTAAARELQQTDRTALDIALEFGWGSAEAFTRAFSRVWGVTPSEYRRSWRFSGLCPRLDFPRHFMREGELIMTIKYDISELYDYIRSKQGTYALSFDTSHLMEINDTLGHEAGDKVILECLHRIDRECTDGMMMFRIGGDEFVMMTGLSDKSAVEALAKRVLSHNGECVPHNGAEIPVSMRAGAVLLKSGKLSYSELFAELVSAPADVPGKVKF